MSKTILDKNLTCPVSSCTFNSFSQNVSTTYKIFYFTELELVNCKIARNDGVMVKSTQLQPFIDGFTSGFFFLASVSV